MIHPLETRKQIAARLKQAREKAGYTSAESFCEKNKLSLNHYQDQEVGRITLKLTQATYYCQLLNMSLYWLLFGELK